MTLGERIIKCRELRGWSRNKLAKVAGVPESSVRNYESNSNDPSLFNISCIATALGVPLDYLVGLSNKM